jgi:hypothetical protein
MQPLVQGYDELMLRLDRRDGGSYHVVASTRAAEASADFEFPFNELEIENFILRVSRPRGRRRIDASAMGEARRFGAGLFTALFGGEVQALYRDALIHARQQGRGVRITLCLSKSPELIEVPWEYLFDEPDFLAVSAFTPVVRYLDLPRAYRPLLVEPPLRVLAVVSSPAEYDRLDVESERDNLTRALSDLIDAGTVELHWLERPTLGGLLKALQTQTFHALHYVGHGAYDREAERGVLLFEDEAGWARPVSGDKLGMILHDFWSLRLAVLNACEGARTARSDPFAGVAGSLVRRDIPAVVAMQFEISDEAAIVFAGGFYRPLAAGLPVDASLAAARLAILAERSDDIEWGTPVLFMRVPDGRVFDTGHESGPADARSILETVAAPTTSPTNGDHGSVAVAEPELALAGQSRGDRLSNNEPTAGSVPPAAIPATQSTTGHGGRTRLLAVAALAALVVIVVGAAALDGGGPSAGHKVFAASAQPFTITYDGRWRAVKAAVPGVFALSGSSLHPGSDHATSSDSQPARLVSGDATLAAGVLTTSASIPGGAPPALVGRYGHPFALVDAQIAGRSGREYSWSSAGRRVVAYVLPTPTSDGAIICQAPTSAAAALRACGALAARAHASTDRILIPGPDRGLARAIAGPLKAVKASRSTVGRLRGPLSARRQRAAKVSLTEARAAALLAKIAPPPRYRQAIARLTTALSHEAAAFAALARAARANNRTAYSSAARHVAAASRASATASRRVGVYQLGAPALGVLRLAGPPPAPHPSQAITQPVQSSTTSGATPGPASSPAPPASGGAGNGSSTTYVTPFS